MNVFFAYIECLQETIWISGDQTWTFLKVFNLGFQVFPQTVVSEG